MNSNLIGISGFARSGKDTFHACCKELLTYSGQESKNYSFASALKQELDPLLLKYTGISAFTTNDSEKSIIRPLLVTYGTDIRRRLNRNCWIDKIKDQIKLDLQNNLKVFITDVRFLNEVEWLKSNGGVLVNMSREGVVAANNDESEQYELFKHLIDYRVSWPNLSGDFDTKRLEYVLDSGIFKNSYIGKNFQTPTAK